ILFSSEMDEIDLMSAYRMATNNIPNIRNVILCGMDHPSVQIFHMDNTIGKLIKDFADTLEIHLPIPRESSITPNSKLIPKLYDSVKLKKENNYNAWLSSLEEINKEFPKTAIVLSKLGEARLKNNDDTGAISAWKQCIKICDYQFEAHAKLGAIQRLKGKLDDAYHNLTKAISINPFGAHTYHTLGLLFQDKKNYPMAEIN
ncbi:hypothetical protein V2A85_24280, partial [Yersinia sp. 1252 StPb PI]|uniref:tetratricopeptide repeat protein n=1 Tax=Yersinia sp. 1252 StPb PI TaxID=3117404 RepID=UPI003B27C30D